MKPRCLLLAMSVLCLLLVAPAAALSQGSSVRAGCGSATIDGVLSPGEWSAATRVDLTDAAPVLQHVTLQSSGSLYLMNDQSYLYLGAAVDLAAPVPEEAALSGIVLDPEDWHSQMCLMFTDEGNAQDDEWDAAGCEPVLPGEGQFCAEQGPSDYPYPEGADFKGWSKAQPCCNIWVPTEGVDVEALLGSGVTLVWEWKVDLTASKVDKLPPDGCFRLGSWTFVEGSLDTLLVDGYGAWPGGLAAPDKYTLLPEDWNAWPGTFGTLCLNPCGAGFVPEPGTIALLGSGLMGLAGYATLRWKARQ